MPLFAHRSANDRWQTHSRDHRPAGAAPPGTTAKLPRPRLLRRGRAPRRHSVLAWALALGVGAAIAVVAVAAWQDPRSVGTQLDDAVASVRNAGSQAGRAVAHSQDAAARASRDVVDGVSAAIDDTDISAKVKAALAVDPALSASRIDVRTDWGIVRLAGPAPDAAARQRATVLAAAPQGVRGVDNRLTLPQPGSVVAVAGK